MSICDLIFDRGSPWIGNTLGTTIGIFDAWIPVPEVYGHCDRPCVVKCSTSWTVPSILLIMLHPTKNTLHIARLSPMGAFGHPNCKPTLLMGSVCLACKIFNCISACIQHMMLLCRELQPRPYLPSFKRKLTAKDTRRLQKNKAMKRHQMVKKTISKSGKVQVYLDFNLKPTSSIPHCWTYVVKARNLQKHLYTLCAFTMVVPVCFPCLRIHIPAPKMVSVGFFT